MQADSGECAGGLPPLASWPTEVAFAGGRGWLLPLAGAVLTQTDVDRADADVALGVHGFLEQLVDAGIAERLPGATLLHDWRTLRHVQPGGVNAWLSRTKRTAAAFRDSKIFIACDVSPLLRMVLRPAMLTNQALTNIAAPELVESPGPIIERLGLRPPRPGTLAAWLSSG